MPNLRDYFQLHFIVIIWGFTAILGLLISVSSLNLVVYRTLLATILLWGVVYWRKQNLHISQLKALQIMFTGGLIALHWILFFQAARVANASVCLAGMATTTLWTSLAEPLFNKRKIRLFELALSVIMFGGLYIVFHFEMDKVAGLSMAIFAALLGAVFSVINGQWIKQYNHYVITFYEMLGAWIVATLIWLGFALLAKPQELEYFLTFPTFSDWLYIFILAFVCTVYAYSVGVKLMKKFTAFAINLTINLEPVYGIVLAYLIFGENEKMTWGFYVGTLVILISVLSYPYLNRYFMILERKQRLNKAMRLRTQREKAISQ
ncbi:MAG: DMT family transporter [Cytophagales bacterium]|nr:DMT family transporter [Cytophagales bacterium]